MKKLISLILIIIILAAGASYVAYLNSALILARIIFHKTMTPVTIENVDFNPQSFVIGGLLIANPKEAQLPTALKVQKITVDAPYKNYIKDPIVINQVLMNNIYLNIQLYTKDQTKGNWQTIMENMAVDHDSLFSIEREAIIKKLILTNIKIDLILSDGKVYHLSPIQRLEFDNITSDKGIPTQEISEIIVQKMMQQIFLEKGLKSILDAPANVIKGVVPFL